jgi:hypothetical protein
VLVLLIVVLVLWLRWGLVSLRSRRAAA